MSEASRSNQDVSDRAREIYVAHRVLALGKVLDPSIEENYDFNIGVGNDHFRQNEETYRRLATQEANNRSISIKAGSVRRQKPSDPEEMAATRAIDPITGRSVAGPTVNAHSEKELILLPTKNSPSPEVVTIRPRETTSKEIHEQRRRRRRKAGLQARQMPLR